VQSKTQLVGGGTATASGELVLEFGLVLVLTRSTSANLIRASSPCTDSCVSPAPHWRRQLPSTLPFTSSNQSCQRSSSWQPSSRCQPRLSPLSAIGGHAGSRNSTSTTSVGSVLRNRQQPFTNDNFHRLLSVTPDSAFTQARSSNRTYGPVASAHSSRSGRARPHRCGE